MHQPDHHNQYVQQHQYQQQPPQHQPWMGLSQPVPLPAGGKSRSPPVPAAASSQMHPQFPGMATAIPAVQGSGGSFEIKSLWIGDLQPTWTRLTRSAVSLTLERHTGKPHGYGFVQFLSHAAAERVLQSYNSTLMPNSDKNFRMNWATLGQGLGMRMNKCGL